MTILSAVPKIPATNGFIIFFEPKYGGGGSVVEAEVIMDKYLFESEFDVSIFDTYVEAHKHAHVQVYGRMIYELEFETFKLPE